MSAIQQTSALPAAALRIATRSIASLRSHPLLLAAITLLGFGLRLPLLDRFPLREDEAIYSFWALHFWRVDPFFLAVWPDKPPLYLWLQAGVLASFGPDQAGARLLNIGASTLTIVVVAAIGGWFWGRRGALLAALAISLNPFAITFAPTAFTDPFLVLAGCLAVLMALRRQPFWAGLWLGAAIMTKQQGLLYAPLVLALLAAEWRVAGGELRKLTAQLAPRHWLPLLTGLGLVMVPVLYWDSLRWSVAPSPWDLGVRNYGALAATPVAEWPERLAAWVPLVWHLTASWPMWVLLAGGLALAFIRVNPLCLFGSKGLPDRRRSFHTALSTIAKLVRHENHPYGESSANSSISLVILAAWSVGFLGLHIVTTVQPWDRYLLPLAPVVALGGAGTMAGYMRKAASRSVGLLLVLFVLLLTPPAVQAAGGGIPIGGDHGAYDGLLPALEWLRQETHDVGVLYHQTLGWHYRFYLYDEVEAGRYDLRWFSSAVYLADNAAKTPHRRKLWVEPAWTPLPNLAHHLAVRGLNLQERSRFGSFVIYEIEESDRPYCAWCVCRPHWPGFAILETEGADPMHLEAARRLEAGGAGPMHLKAARR